MIFNRNDVNQLMINENEKLIREDFKIKKNTEKISVFSGVGGN